MIPRLPPDSSHPEDVLQSFLLHAPFPQLCRYHIHGMGMGSSKVIDVVLAIMLSVLTRMLMSVLSFAKKIYCQQHGCQLQTIGVKLLLLF